jgi:hypothetical protein
MGAAVNLAPYTTDDRFDTLAKRVAAFWWGVTDEEVAWAMVLANMVAPEPIANRLYLMHATEDLRYARSVKEWAYRIAVEFVGQKGSGQRRRSLVESYRPDWGHQAARDGVSMALWPHLSDGVPGIRGRALHFKCGQQAYQRVRDEVMRQAGDLIAGYRLDLAECLDERFSRDFTNRWELATGKPWQ